MQGDREIEMCEGVEGMWKYHLREPGSMRALCGHSVMSTPAPMSSWGYRGGHLNEGYCDTCKSLGDTNAG